MNFAALLHTDPIIGFFGTVFGAFLAYALWNWIYSPHLTVTGVERIPILEPDSGGKQYSTRVTVNNVGLTAAKNCEGTIDLRLKHDGDVYRSLVMSPWLAKKADLIVNDNEQQYSTTIPADRTRTVELLRQERTGKIQVDHGSSGRRIIKTTPNSPFFAEIAEPLEGAVLEESKSYSGAETETMATLDPEVVKNADWENSILRLQLETESARPLIVDFDVRVDNEDRVVVEEQQLSHRRRFGTSIYQFINRWQL